MRIWDLAASVLLGLAGGAAAVEMTKPFEALKESRRARLELGKRMAQEKAKELRAEREQKVKASRDGAAKREGAKTE